MIGIGTPKSQSNIPRPMAANLLLCSPNVLTAPWVPSAI